MAVRSTAARVYTFRTHQREGLWYVTRNHAFYGDYNSRDQALAAACFGARAADAQGASATVLDGVNGTVVAHHLPSTR